MIWTMKTSTARRLLPTGAVLSMGLAALVACGASSSGEDPPTTPANSDAAPETTAPPPDVDAAVTPDADATALPVKPTVDTILTGVDDAIDFDVRPSDLVLLRTSPSRIDDCPSAKGTAGASCTSLVASGSMPTDADAGSFEGALHRGNTSIAYVGSTNPPALLLAQGGSEGCAMNCTTDDLTAPGLFRISIGAVVIGAPVRVSTTVPLFFAKAYRTSDGWLVGRGTSFAVAQAHNNEQFDIQGTSTFTVTDDAVATHRYERGYFGPPGSYVQPFVFAAATTSIGIGGYAGAYDDLVDVANYTAIGIIPATAAATAIDGNADLFVRAKDTANDVALTLQTQGPQTLAPAKIPGLTVAMSLFATASYVGFYDPAAASATLHICRVTDVKAAKCSPTDVALPLTAITRMRAVGDSLWILGPAVGKPTVVRVTL